MCLSIPFRIYFKNISEIIKDCFGLEEEKKNKKNSEINMGLIEEQPILNLEESVFISDSEEELEKSYDFMDSD